MRIFTQTFLTEILQHFQQCGVKVDNIYSHFQQCFGYTVVVFVWLYRLRLGIQLLVVLNINCTGRCKSNYYSNAIQYVSN
jgi:hypothetical protein